MLACGIVDLICAADDWMTDEHGNYKYDVTRLQHAHNMCLNKTRQAVLAGKNVAVHNTFTRKWEMQPYLSLPANIVIMHCKGQWQNVHNVPAHIVQRMRERFEEV